jgi:hypothetical protein
MNFVKDYIDLPEDLSLEQIAEDMTKKYQSEDIDYDFMPVISDSISIARSSMDERDCKWRKENITLGGRSRQEVHMWKSRIEALPAYLSNETKEAIKALDAEADQIISEGKIEDVVIYFDKLDISEKKKCLEILNDRYENDN